MSKLLTKIKEEIQTIIETPSRSAAVNRARDIMAAQKRAKAEAEAAAKANVKKEEIELVEATVKSQKYSWGTMKTVHHGSSFNIPLHPEHHQAIAKLKDQQEHKFKTEDGKHWTAKKSGEHVHFQGANGGQKTKVPAHTMDEQAPVAPVPDRKYIKGTPEHTAYKATKKPINGMPTNMNKEEVELDEAIPKSTSHAVVRRPRLPYRGVGTPVAGMDPGYYLHVDGYGIPCTGNKYNFKPNPTDVEYLDTWLKIFKGEVADVTSSGALLKFKTQAQADAFKKTVYDCPYRTCHAGDVSLDGSRESYHREVKEFVLHTPKEPFPTPHAKVRMKGPGSFMKKTTSNIKHDTNMSVGASSGKYLEKTFKEETTLCQDCQCIPCTCKKKINESARRMLIIREAIKGAQDKNKKKIKETPDKPEIKLSGKKDTFEAEPETNPLVHNQRM